MRGIADPVLAEMVHAMGLQEAPHYVNKIHANGEVSTVGLFYSCAEAEKVVAQLRSTPQRSNDRYEIVQANQTYLITRDSQRSRDVKKE